MTLLITIITVFTNLTLGLISYRKNIKNDSLTLLSILAFFVSFWTLLNYFMLTAESESLALFWIRVVILATIFLLLIIHLLLITFPKKNFNLKSQRIIILFFMAVFVSIVSISPYTFHGVKIEDNIINPEVGIGVTFFALFLIYSIGFGVKELINTAKKSKGIQKAQIRYFFLGLVTTFSLIILSYFTMITIFEKSNPLSIIPLFSLILTGFIFYAIAKNRFFGIRRIIGRSIAYLVTAVYIYFAFYFGIFLHSTLWNSPHEPYAYLLTIPLVAIFLYMYNLLSEGFSSGRFLNFLYVYNPIEARDKFIKKVSSEIQLEKLLNIIISELVEIFQVKNIGSILFYSKSKKILYEIYKGGKWRKTNFLNEERTLLDLNKYWEDGYSSIIYVEEINLHIKNSKDKYKETLKKVKNIMKDKNIEIIFPLSRGGKQSSIVFLGEKGNGDAYTIEDFELLDSIIDFTGMAIHNSITHKELQSNLKIIKEFNETLQTKIDFATKKLREKVTDLEEARRKEKDMLDIIGHELRTPLSIIKIHLDLVKNKILQDSSISEVKNHRRYIKKMEEALNREIILLETMISATKFDANRMELYLENVNIIKIVKNSISTFKNQADKKNIKIKFIEPKNKLFAYADRVKLAEILDNLLSNAIKYTQKGEIQINTGIRNDYIMISVKDTGIGIPKDEIKNLGKKFYRVEQYTSKEKNEIVKPGGTGLGLYVSFALIKLMGGTYQVESKENKGSTFSFTLPTYKSQPKINTNSGNVKDLFERFKIR